MKLFFSVIFLASLGFTAQAQSSWFGNTSCSDDGAVIADQAFTSFINVERSMAIGMARAALLIDEGCGIAKLVQANASGDSQDALLSEASEMSLSSDERLWLDLTQSDDPWQPAATAIVESGNEAPVFSWMSSWDTNRGTVAENMEDFAEAYPDHAASAYNMLAYAYADAGWGVEEADMVRALRYLDLYDAAHEGPNAADSRSEILWNAGEKAGAWTAIRSAVDKGGNPSMYADRAGTIWRAMNEENLAKAIHDQVQAFWSGSDEEADMEARAALLAPTSSHCDSNLEACYSATKDEVLAALGAGAEWLSLEVSDVDVTFNSDYRTAVATHMNAGQYKTDDDNVVEYRARASSVWSLDPWSGDWLLIHGNFAPSGGAGIPSTK
jgi:hypothetical protein